MSLVPACLSARARACVRSVVLLLALGAAGACGVAARPAANAAPPDGDGGAGRVGAAGGEVERAAPVGSLGEAPPPVAREFRAAWVTPIWASGVRDWPSRDGLPAEQQQAELRALLDRAVALGLNAVVLHVRTAGDAFYPTPLAPWSAFLSGTQGEPPRPYYDPLAFAVAEAHARGLQLHAWFNPFRAELPNFAGRAAASHVTRAHPEWIVKYGTQTWIDPGQPAARRAVLDAVVDVVRRYDVDGVHIDDYFYPYRERAPARVRRSRPSGCTTAAARRRARCRVRTVRTPGGDLPFGDDASWRRYGAGSGQPSRAAWRRANVDDFVRSMYREVKQVKPWVLVGVSPFGIWRSGVPSGVTGLDAYGEIYADAHKWLVEGWLDYLAPQLYWRLSGEQQRFRRLDAWWRAENVRGRHIWPGLHTAEAGGLQRWPAGEIAEQISFIREARARDPRATAGHVHFRLGAVRDVGDPLGELLRRTYGAPALVPASPWLGAAPPAAPQLRATGLGVLASPSDSTPVAWWLVQWRTTDGWANELHHGAERELRPRALPWARVTGVAVSALNRAGVTGAAGGVAVH